MQARAENCFPVTSLCMKIRISIFIAFNIRGSLGIVCVLWGKHVGIFGPGLSYFVYMCWYRKIELIFEP